MGDVGGLMLFEFFKPRSIVAAVVVVGMFERAAVNKSGEEVLLVSLIVFCGVTALISTEKDNKSHCIRLKLLFNCVSHCELLSLFCEVIF